MVPAAELWHPVQPGHGGYATGRSQSDWTPTPHGNLWRWEIPRILWISCIGAQCCDQNKATRERIWLLEPAVVPHTARRTLGHAASMDSHCHLATMLRREGRGAQASLEATYTATAEQMGDLRTTAHPDYLRLWIIELLRLRGSCPQHPESIMSSCRRTFWVLSESYALMESNPLNGNSPTGESLSSWRDLKTV